MQKKILVGILMGSKNDISVMNEAAAVLKHFDIPCEILVASAHRTPQKARDYAKGAKERGLKVIIAGAGSAAHLAGAIAAETNLPVIGVPIDSSPLLGLDALLSTVQMPGGVPVASMAVGKSGAKNAGIFAAQILALSDEKLAERLKGYRSEMEKKIEEDNAEINVKE